KKQLEDMKKRFIKGAIQNKLSKENAKIVWWLMEKFSGYGFNKSHAASYAMIAYQCAYLKTYYPIEFYTSLLNIEETKNYRKIVNEIQQNKIKVKQLNLNKSEKDFICDDKNIYWGFSKINGIGDKAAVEIIKFRDKHKITSLKQFLRDGIDISWRVCNKRVVEILIQIGAFDFKNTYRNYLLHIYTRFNTKTNKTDKKIERNTVEGRNELLNRAKKDADIFFKKEKNKYISDDEMASIERKTYKMNLVYSSTKIKDRDIKV
ncbi:unnamed protein product, partial [marine sediment metagenome]